jgi:hypothetical protein
VALVRKVKFIHRTHEIFSHCLACHNRLDTYNVLEGTVDWNQLVRSEHRVLQALGGIDQFEFELKNVVAEASMLNNGIYASVVEFNYGSNALIAKICFADGICWAAKMMENCPLSELVTWFATEAMTLVDRYCPEIPIAKLKRRSTSQGRLVYYLTEWIEGKPLSTRVNDSFINGEIFSIPENVIISLAEFVYNLTTCPIPEREREIPSRLYIDGLTSKIRCDFLSLTIRNNTALEAITTTAWAKLQFVAQRLISSKPSFKPFDGLDEILLLSWVA